MAAERLQKDYPWIQTPLIIGAPMRLISLAPLATEISRAGGIGFIGAGTDTDTLSTHLENASSLLQHSPIASASQTPTLPIGIGIICWGASLPPMLPLLQKYKPAAIWLFAPKSTSDLATWSRETRRASPLTKIWVQVGSVTDAVDVVRTVGPDVLVIQGTDAGGHGLVRGAGIVTLFPEVSDAVQELVREEGGSEPVLVAAGGIAEKRGVGAALALGAAGVVMGTRFLAAREAEIAKGYQDEVIRVGDGGQSTVRSKVYDGLRGTTGWADSYDARGIVNRSYFDAMAGMDEEENKKLYVEEMEKGDAGWGENGRMTAYAGAAVGLVREVKGAGEIVEEVRRGAREVLDRLRV